MSLCFGISLRYAVGTTITAFIVPVFCIQHHRGRATSQEMWVFGLVDVSHQPALGLMKIVPQRDAATLLPIIQANVAPGTIIHSDQWAAYNHVSSLPNVSSHSTVNHSVTFVDPVTGTHTQNVESYWNRVKTNTIYINIMIYLESRLTAVESGLAALANHCSHPLLITCNTLLECSSLPCVLLYNQLSSLTRLVLSCSNY